MRIEINYIRMIAYLMAGAMVSCHKGRNLSTVSFKDSVRGISDFLRFVYRLSFPGYLGSDSSNLGGGMS